LVLVLAIAGCGGGDDGSGPPAGAQTGGIRGTVVVGSTGLANVNVSATRNSTTRQATTNGSGQFNFTGLEVGTWSVSVTVPSGYALASGETGTRSVSVSPNAVAEAGTLALAQSGGGGNNGDVAQVDMSGTAFSPQTVTIAVGKSVRWTNKDPVQHNVTGESFGTGNLDPNESATVQFNTAGTFEYECTLHAGMTGTVVVQ